MIVCFCGYGDQVVGVFFQGFVSKDGIDDIVQDDVVIGMNGVIYFGVSFQ